MKAEASEYGDRMLSTDFVVASPTARMAMTAPTPMMSPSMVSSERSGLCQIVSRACPKNSRSSFMAQAFDGGKRCRPRRWIGSEKDPDEDGKADGCEQDGEPVDRHGTIGKAVDHHDVHEQRGTDAERRPDGASDERDRDRLGQELPGDVASRSADRLADADLARALDDRDEHDVHDPDAADDEGDETDRRDADRDRLDDCLELIHLLREILRFKRCVRTVEVLEDPLHLVDDRGGRNAWLSPDLEIFDLRSRQVVIRRVGDVDRIRIASAEAPQQTDADGRVDAYDFETPVLDAHVLSDRRSVAEKFLLRGHDEVGHRARAVDVAGLEPPPLCHGEPIGYVIGVRGYLERVVRVTRSNGDERVVARRDRKAAGAAIAHRREVAPLQLHGLQRTRTLRRHEEDALVAELRQAQMNGR